MYIRPAGEECATHTSGMARWPARSVSNELGQACVFAVRRVKHGPWVKEYCLLTTDAVVGGCFTHLTWHLHCVTSLAPGFVIAEVLTCHYNQEPASSLHRFSSFIVEF